MKSNEGLTVRPYQAFAGVYDLLMSEVPYDQWVGGALKAYRLCQRALLSADDVQEPLDVLDLACGTGTTSIILALKGHRVVGADASDEMLTLAASKGYGTRGLVRSARPAFVKGDMRAFDYGPRFDLVTCFCDGLNHLRSVEDLRGAFASVRASLRSGGVFVFDMNTQYKLSCVLGDNTFVDEFEGGICIMENTLDEQSRRVRIHLRFLLQEANGLYRRVDEEHDQAWFGDEEVLDALRSASLSPRGHWDGYELHPARAHAERAVFSAVAV